MRYQHAAIHYRHRAPLAGRYSLEWDPLQSDLSEDDGDWASFVRGLGDAKAWVTDQFSVGLAVVIVLAILLTVAVLLERGMVHAFEVWLGR